ITEKLTPSVIPMGSASGLGSRAAAYTSYGPADTEFTARLVDLLADHDDAFLAAYVADDTAMSHRQLRARLAAQVRRALVHPVFFGSAITGAGVDALTDGIRELLPAAPADVDGPVSGTVFKVERGRAGEKIAYARMFTGTLRVRDRLRLGASTDDSKVTAISVFDRGSAVRGASVAAGQIGKLWGLGDVRIGDALGTPPPTVAVDHHFSPPTLETVVLPCRPSDKGALHVALTQLAEQDPLINLRQDEIRQEISVSLYGEVQKEVVQATLADEFGVEATFRETTTICIERLVGTGEAMEKIGGDDNPFLATIGLRVEPAALGSGVTFQLGVELGSMPLAFFNAVEDTIVETLRQGINGWQVADCTVTMTHSGYCPRQSHAHGTFDKSMSSTGWDFRYLTPLVLMNALRQAGTTVHEPMHRFGLTIPADLFGTVLPVLVRLGAAPRTQTTVAGGYLLAGDIPVARVHELQQLLPSLTRGEGELECAFDHYREVHGAIPARSRSDHNPLNRREYLLHVVRRV
ncbi:MAG TPA: GTP-binding protein, partial [Pseudonocardiaceae bacterium]|nr:GTP-binding protein [Pseudonocardiaceae bacterium]